MERGDWDVVGADNGLHSVHLLCQNCSPEEAVEMAGQRVLQKYGKGADLTWWKFSVRPAVAGEESAVRWFYVGPDGRALPLKM